MEITLSIMLWINLKLDAEMEVGAESVWKQLFVIKLHYILVTYCLSIWNCLRKSYTGSPDDAGEKEKEEYLMSCCAHSTMNNPVLYGQLFKQFPLCYQELYLLPGLVVDNEERVVTMLETSY